MLLAGRIDSRILQDAKKFRMTRKELVSFMKFLKLTGTGDELLNSDEVRKAYLGG